MRATAGRPVGPCALLFVISLVTLLFGTCIPIWASDGAVVGSGTVAISGYDFVTGPFSLNAQQNGASVSGAFQAMPTSVSLWVTVTFVINGGDINGTMTGSYHYTDSNGTDATGTGSVTYISGGGDFGAGRFEIELWVPWELSVINGGVHFTPPYTINLLYDPTKAAKVGSVIPIKLQVFQNGTNVSSASLPVTAKSVVLVSTGASGDVISPGNANPDNNFRYDASLAGYIFNLSTRGLATGTYNLNFTINGGTQLYSAPFQVR